MKNIITILMVAVISFFTGNVSANTAVPLPHNLTDVTDGTGSGVRGPIPLMEDVNTGYIQRHAIRSGTRYGRYGVLGWFLRRD